MAEDENRDATLGNRVWRIERDHEAVAKRIEKLESRVETVGPWRLDSLERRLEDLEKRPTSGSSHGLLGESPTVKTIVYGLMAMVVALATGQFLNFLGVLK